MNIQALILLIFHELFKLNYKNKYNYKNAIEIFDRVIKNLQKD